MNFRRWVAGRGPWLVLLLLFALAYFGSYVRAGINFRDEGGTEVLLAQRLLHGERPFVDLVLGYNVLWFYPIAGLFKLFGTSFVLLRGYCFFLSTVTAVTGFFAVTRAGQRPWLGFLTGLLLIVVPGMTFKNYMPLLAVTNGACLLHCALALPERRLRWQLAGGLLLGLTFLIRIDVGLFVSGLWAGALALRALEERRLWPALRGLSVIALLVCTLHLPVWLDARQRGFGALFLEQYANWPKSFVQQVQNRLHPAPPPLALSAPAPAPLAATAPAPAPAPAAGPVPNQHTLARQTFTDWAAAKNDDQRMLIVLLYAPLLSLAALTLWALVRLLRGWWCGRETEFTLALGALVLLGSALTTFPQYFFFRPDAPHLSEFSPGFWVAAVGSLLLLARGGHRLLIAAIALLLTAHASLYLYRMVPDRWTGTIAARKNRTVYFAGENGVHVYLTHREFEGLTQIRRLITDHTERTDYLVAYPYHPGFNVLADRPTYERNVYVDNAIAEPHWNENAIARLQRYHPAVVILSDWEVNGTNDSRFSVWAAPTKAWIEQHYDDQGTYLDFEIYTRRAPSTQDRK